KRSLRLGLHCRQPRSDHHGNGLPRLFVGKPYVAAPHAEPGHHHLHPQIQKSIRKAPGEPSRLQGYLEPSQPLKGPPAPVPVAGNSLPAFPNGFPSTLRSIPDSDKLLIQQENILLAEGDFLLRASSIWPGKALNRALRRTCAVT